MILKVSKRQMLGKRIEPSSSWIESLITPKNHLFAESEKTWTFEPIFHWLRNSNKPLLHFKQCVSVFYLIEIIYKVIRRFRLWVRQIFTCLAYFFRKRILLNVIKSLLV